MVIGKFTQVEARNVRAFRHAHLRHVPMNLGRQIVDQYDCMSVCNQLRRKCLTNETQTAGDKYLHH